MLSVMPIFPEFELALIDERQREGIAVSKTAEPIAARHSAFGCEDERAA
jgi:DNA invertase Pin-like site-specific DNA recombinase